MTENKDFLIQEETLKDIANNIRDIDPTLNEMSPKDMANEIKRLTAIIEQDFDANSPNAQSGKAVAEAVTLEKERAMAAEATETQNRDMADNKLQSQINNIISKQETQQDKVITRTLTENTVTETFDAPNGEQVLILQDENKTGSIKFDKKTDTVTLIGTNVKVENVVTPVNDKDATNKSYVDAADTVNANAITQNEENIVNEITERKAEDVKLQQQITENRADIKNNKDNLDTEIQNRVSADEELQQQISNITAVQIRNKSEVIESTEANVQTVATNYIKTNYDRNPQNFDGLIITVTDKNNDKILYIYSEVSNIWINSGINDVDLSNYYQKSEIDSKIDTINQSITDEIQARTTADNTLQTNINNEVARAKAAEAANESLINKEIDERKAAIEDKQDKFATYTVTEGHGVLAPDTDVLSIEGKTITLSGNGTGIHSQVTVAPTSTQINGQTVSISSTDGTHISNVVEPVEDTDAVNKAYVDDNAVGQKTPDKGEIFSTYTGDTANKALGKASSAFGENNIAGCYGFKVVGFVKGSYNPDGSVNEYAKVTLSTDDTHFDNIAVNDVVSIRINYNRDGLAVQEVDKATKTVTLNYALANFPDYVASDNDYLWLVEKPQAGDTSIGIGAFAGGFTGNHANQDGSFAFGRNNIADGRFSVAMGSGNKAGYNTFVFGKDNTALLSESATVFGRKNIIDTYINASLINGAGNEIHQAESSLINGAGNEIHQTIRQCIITGDSNVIDAHTTHALLNGSQNHIVNQASNVLMSGVGLENYGELPQTILGKYNKKSRSLLSIGNGTSDSDRSNAFEVYDGGWAELQTQGTTNNSVVINTQGSLNGLLNKLDTASATPQDNDYFISQFAGGGTTTTTYHRRPVSALYNYIKGKADTTVTSTSTNLVTSKAVDTAINSKLSSVYKAKGSVTFSELPTTLTSAQEGFVYNISEEFTTTALFIEGAGKTYPSGTNVVVVKDGSTYKYDVLAGMVDLSGYATKTDLSGKLDKVTATSSLRRVYVINADGTQGTNSISSGADNSSIAVRTSTGTLRVKTPTNDFDATTKKYVDDIVGDINTILATLVDVTTAQSDEEVINEEPISEEPTI